jgi:hypothetical protein
MTPDDRTSTQSIPSRGDGTWADVAAFIESASEEIDWAIERHRRALELLA